MSYTRTMILKRYCIETVLYFLTNLAITQTSFSQPSHIIQQERCKSHGGRPGLPIPNKPDGFCGRKPTLKWGVVGGGGRWGGGRTSVAIRAVRQHGTSSQSRQGWGFIRSMDGVKNTVWLASAADAGSDWLDDETRSRVVMMRRW